jgi:hypothetical protein
MAMPAPQVSEPVVVATRGGRLQPAWILWILISILGAVLGAIVAWQIRSLVPRGPATLGQDLAYVATVMSSLVASGCQWALLRRQRLDLAWWVPAAVGANLLNAMVVIPSALRIFVATTQVGPTPMQTEVVAGGVALGAAGLVIGVAQALVLRAAAGNIAWAWMPATAVGGALAGAITTALSVQLYGLSALATISLVAGAGALLTAACQAPVFVRIIR